MPLKCPLCPPYTHYTIQRKALLLYLNSLPPSKINLFFSRLTQYSVNIVHLIFTYIFPGYVQQSVEVLQLYLP